jgi:hypothetical protein
MADLKNIDEAALVATIEKQARYAKERIETAAQEAIAAVRDAVAGMRGLPDSAVEMFKQASAFFTCEMQFGRTHAEECPVQITVYGGGRDEMRLLGNAKPLFLPGVNRDRGWEDGPTNQYRVFVVFMPMESA